MCVVSGVMLEKRSSKEVSAQDSSAIEWKWFLQEHLWRKARRFWSHSRAGSPVSSHLHLRACQALLTHGWCLVNCSRLTHKKLLGSQVAALMWMGSILLGRQLTATSWWESSNWRWHQIGSVGWIVSVFLAVMEELNNNQSPDVGCILTLGQCSIVLPCGQVEGQWKMDY